ncbi:MAG TPA: hypothetical protein VI844_01620, partial [Coxiellaceae bacterium]|nr:hypothetical protein [Coxiellaceae bacterium]
YWRDLSREIEAGKIFEWKNYVISRHQNLGKDTAFIKFTLQRQNTKIRRSIDSYPKLHIAVTLEQMQLAFDTILDVLVEQKITEFKVLLASQFQAMEASDQQGKHFTVYFETLDEAYIKSVAHIIDQKLQTFEFEGIKLTPPAPEKRATSCKERTDQFIEGCQFVTFAPPRPTNAIDACALNRTPSPDDGAVRPVDSRNPIAFFQLEIPPQASTPAASFHYPTN